MNIEQLKVYMNDGLSIKDISVLTDTSYSTIRYYFKKYGLLPNPHTKKHQCIHCNEQDVTQFYGKNKEVCKPCFNRLSVQRWNAQKQKAVEYKGGKCVYCGYSKCLSALEFHHRDPSEKEFAWDMMRKQAWDKVVTELDKCDLVCANCHREQHEKMRQR